ncbi:MAG TPA: hypothetical protein VFZ58_02730 [Candidatus Saccharimonadales bacterium]
MVEQSIAKPANHESEPRRHFGLSSALMVAIGIALFLTGVSTALYLSSNFSRIDLSKPKNTDIRDKVSASTNEESQIDTSGPITKDSIKKMREHMQSAQANLKKAGGFDTPVLEDATLGIGAGEPAPQ